MNRLNPDATLDCLYVVSSVDSHATGVAPQEIHLFAYLGCLLWIYRQNPAADWGYAFVGTELGAPFSVEIDAALDELSGRGFLRRVSGRVQLTEPAQRVLHDLAGLDINRQRVECMKAACSSTAAFSVGMVSHALANEPDLSRAKTVPMNRLLLEDPARKQLYLQFEALRSAIASGSSDLRLPAFVWLTALYRVAESGSGQK